MTSCDRIALDDQATDGFRRNGPCPTEPKKYIPDTSGAVAQAGPHRTVMPMDNSALDREFLAWWLQQSNVAFHEFASRRPDFLVISPPKTASTWLADNLRCHPQIFVPAAKKVKYFSYYSKWLDLNWYLDQFSAAGGRVKGEVSPSYAILP